MRTDPRVSFAQLETWPDDGRRYELYDGEAIVVPAPNLPDLAVEVLSAATEKRDRGRKMELLGRYELPEYWLIDPGGRSLEAHVSGTTSRLEPARAVAGDRWFVSPTLAGLTFAVARLFEQPA